jgi:phage tail protein X
VTRVRETLPRLAQVVEEYVKARGGKRVIRKILVANNGLAAVRFIRRLREVTTCLLVDASARRFRLRGL